MTKIYFTRGHGNLIFSLVHLPVMKITVFTTSGEINFHHALKSTNDSQLCINFVFWNNSC